MHRTDEESSFFDNLPGEGPEHEAEPGVELLTEQELRELGPDQLVLHALDVQNRYAHVESDNRLLQWEFREYNDNLTYFSRAAKLAHRLSAANIDRVADVAVSEVAEYFRCRFGAFYLYDPETKLLSPHSTMGSTSLGHGTLHRDDDADHILVRLFFSHSQPFIAEYLSPDGILIADDDERLQVPIPEDWHRMLGKKAIFFPLHVKTVGNRDSLFLGGLVIGDCCGDLQPKDAEIAIFFGDLLSSSLYNARLVQQLNALTIIEPLTQIFNRRHLIDQLSSAMVQARRHDHKLSIAMLDIDHFKRFNDTYGHLCGDEVLRQLARVLKESIRDKIDIPARYGGEEFMLVMPFTDLAAAAEVADRLRRKIKSHTFSFEQYRMSVTCSIGLAEYVHDESLEEFIDRADACLYQAKRGGRDQVCCASASREGA